jgi:Zn-dependent M28 family amino/carboxypeptidase
MYDEERPLVAAHPQVRSRAKMYILIIMGVLILGALIGAIATFSMWRSELELQTNKNTTEPNTPSPSETPTSAPVSNTPETQTPTAAPTSVVGLNQTFSSRMTVEEVMTHLQKLQDIAYANNGTRYAGSIGYNVTGQWVMDTLNSYNYFKVERQDFTVPRYVELAPPTLAQVYPNPTNFTYGTDFVAFQFAKSGDVTANISAVPNVGCNDVDWAGFPEGNIALVLRGDCPFVQKTAHAMAAKASALLLYNNVPGVMVGSTLDNVTFPVLFLSHSVGQLLKDLSSLDPVAVHVTSSGQTTYVGTFNIVAETLKGPASPVVVVGAHLDSVPAGPGINDDGTGTATLLALARIVAETDMFKDDSPAKLRLGWWGAEELGLLGSTFYVNDLKNNHPEQLAEIALNLNFDMLGSPNFMRGIHNGSSGPEDVRHGSALIQQLFEGYFQSQQLPFMLTAFDGRSDYAAFIANGIPAGGLFTGAEVLKTMEERKIFGGLANTAYDPCYHQACDTIENINTQVLNEMSQCVAEVTATVLFNPSILTDINPKFAKTN